MIFCGNHQRVNGVLYAFAANSRVPDSTIEEYDVLNSSTLLQLVTIYITKS